MKDRPWMTYWSHYRKWGRIEVDLELRGTWGTWRTVVHRRDWGMMYLGGILCRIMLLWGPVAIWVDILKGKA